MNQGEGEERNDGQEIDWGIFEFSSPKEEGREGCGTKGKISNDDNNTKDWQLKIIMEQSESHLPNLRHVNMILLSVLEKS